MWHILIVDDNFINRKLLLAILKDKAHCDVASDGKEALEAYSIALKEGHPYQLVLLDIAMPEIDGMEVLRTIRKEENDSGMLLGQGIPIIMVTAQKENFMEAFHHGCDDFIVKPIQPAKLIAKISEKLA